MQQNTNGTTYKWNKIQKDIIQIAKIQMEHNTKVSKYK